MAEAKPKAEVEQITMNDGRVVGFAGKRRMLKNTELDQSKIAIDGANVLIQEGAVRVRLDFRNGATLTYTPKAELLGKLIGHGAEQKLGDETAGVEKVEDMVLAVEDLIGRLDQGEWGAERAAGDSFAGASVVIRAICEVTGKSLDVVKAFLQKKLDDAKARGEKLSRKELYDGFRAPGSKTAEVIKRLEEEALAKSTKVNAADMLAEI